MLRKAKNTYKVLHDIGHPLSTKVLNPDLKNVFSGLSQIRSIQSVFGRTGPEPDLKKVAGPTGTGFSVAHC